MRIRPHQHMICLLQLSIPRPLAQMIVISLGHSPKRYSLSVCRSRGSPLRTRKEEQYWQTFSANKLWLNSSSSAALFRGPMLLLDITFDQTNTELMGNREALKSRGSQGLAQRSRSMEFGTQRYDIACKTAESDSFLATVQFTSALLCKSAGIAAQKDAKYCRRRLSI